MSEKYTDLIHAIESSDSMTGCERVTVEAVLAWLDSHPDQVPGRKKFPIERVEITDTEAYELYQSAKSFSLEDFKLALESIDGIETVDDPEPTNAEKLRDAITNAAHGVGIGSTTANIKAIAEHLDAAGVKAPGGDE